MIAERIFDRVFTRLIKRGTLELVHADGRRVNFGQPDPAFPDVSIRITDATALIRIMRDRSLGTAEAFMDGSLVIERGDIMQLAQLVQANRPFESRMRKAAGRLAGLRTQALSALRESNRNTQAKANISHHYDIGNDLYRLMLDERMQYSCAYWSRPTMTLDEAQEAKLAHIAAKLDLSAGQNVLDIGCGWGGMAIFLAKRARVQVTGITLSEEQLAFARQRARDEGLTDQVRFELVDYRQLPEQGRQFDRIVSVGMFEHVGRPQFETFFDVAARLLADDGVMLLHTIGRMGGPGRTDAFTRKYIFPGGYIPALSEIMAASEKSRLMATDIETLRLHYAMTLRAWYDRCVRNRDRIEAMYDARFFRMWMFYLAGATASFENGGMCNYQIQYCRNRHTLPLTRDYIAASEGGFLTSRP